MEAKAKVTLVGPKHGSYVVNSISGAITIELLGPAKTFRCGEWVTEAQAQQMLNRYNVTVVAERK